ncbi:hypothetical protein [Selenomonas sp. KH1T6]|uniref:hypothetical protein n=1 Tax=Selenomonas sp. KH1T6 TaxID=3158784 RepID=UPI0008A7DDE6|nr:hypothetical protein SAMN05216583_103186 [Selenomonas ruminantium]
MQLKKTTYSIPHKKTEQLQPIFCLVDEQVVEVPVEKVLLKMIGRIYNERKVIVDEPPGAA